MNPFSEYQSGNRALNLSFADARAMAEYLGKIGFPVVRLFCQFFPAGFPQNGEEELSEEEVIARDLEGYTEKTPLHVFMQFEGPIGRGDSEAAQAVTLLGSGGFNGFLRLYAALNTSPGQPRAEVMMAGISALMNLPHVLEGVNAALGEPPAVHVQKSAAQLAAERGGMG